MRNYLPKLLFCLLLLTGGMTVNAQTMQDAGVQLTPPARAQIVHTSGSARTTCSQDTVAYAINKATGLRGLTLNNASSATALGQYLNVPQPITLSGMQFYGWSPASANPSNTPVTITCEVYAAGLDSLPTGTAIASGTVVVDTTFGGGSLAVLRKSVTFSAPIVVSAPVVLVVANNSSVSVAMVTSDWTTADGQQEWLASALIGTNWLHGYAVNVGGYPFDCDVVIEPYVSYELAADFSPNPTCLTGPTNVVFTNASSPVLFDRMYSLTAFLGIDAAACTWDFGDGSATVNAVDTNHNYAAAGAYNVMLSDSLFGWSTLCAHDTTVTIGAAPVSVYSSSVAGLTATFSDASTGAPTGYLWDFGDGNTSTLQNPTHTYAVAGTYIVCQTVTSLCGSDSSCSSVTAVSCAGPTAAFTSTSNELDAMFTDGSTSSGSTSYVWDFGDGNTSTMQNPMHTYALAGIYNVCLIVSDSCGTDSTCSSVTITCTMPMSMFTAGGAGFNVQFSNNSTGATSTFWDFGDGTTSTMTSPSHLYATTNTYTVCLYSTNACGTDTMCTQVSVPLVGVQDGLLDGRVTAFPNPTSSQLNVSIEMFNPDDLELSIHNMLGQQIFVRTLEGVQTEQVAFDLSTLESGIYMLKVNGETGSMTKRIVLNK